MTVVTFESYIADCLSKYGRSTGMNKKPIYGVGINDAPYITQTKNVNWFCPHYKVWNGMLRRCYSDQFKEKRTSHVHCRMNPEWFIFSNFLKWSVENYVEGWELDKDILVLHNKIYSSDNCAFVPAYLNSLLKQKSNDNGLLLGVSSPRVGRNEGYKATISCNGKYRSLGMHSCPESAHKSWQIAKIYSIQGARDRYSIEPNGYRVDVELMLNSRIDKLYSDLSNCKQTEII